MDGWVDGWMELNGEKGQNWQIAYSRRVTIANEEKNEKRRIKYIYKQSHIHTGPQTHMPFIRLPIRLCAYFEYCCWWNTRALVCLCFRIWNIYSFLHTMLPHLWIYIEREYMLREVYYVYIYMCEEERKKERHSVNMFISYIPPSKITITTVVVVVVVVITDSYQQRCSTTTIHHHYHLLYHHQ